MPPEAIAAFEAGKQAAFAHFQRVPPNPHYTYSDTPNGNGNGRRSPKMSVEGLTIPIVMAISILVSAVLLAWWGATQFATLKSANDIAYTNVTNSIERLGEKILSITEPINERIARLESKLERGVVDRWSKTDHDLWCAKTESINRDWRCAGYTDPDRQSSSDESYMNTPLPPLSKPTAKDWTTLTKPRK